MQNKYITTFDVSIECDTNESGEKVVEIALTKAEKEVDEKHAARYAFEFKYEIIDEYKYSKEEVKEIWEEIEKYEEAHLENLAWYAGVEY